DSVFATALQYYLIDIFAAVFSFVVLVAAFSCANSGFYASVRSLYGLSRARMAPRIFRKLNSGAIPLFAFYISIIAVWT
ncbi:amino acid permease, partial [Francisella tularensis subsp. holarctica]|nr:amino acid permease [Francisella tularensis subsp. holarctica]